MRTLVDLAARASESWPDGPALHFDANGESLSFREFDLRSNALAWALQARGVVPGDRVIVMSANRALFPLAWFAIMKAGAIMVPINIAYRSDDALHLAELAEAKAIFCDGERASFAARLLDACAPGAFVVCDGDDQGRGWLPFRDFGEGLSRHPVPAGLKTSDIVNIQFTSGTSGLPKGCMLSHEYWLTLAVSVSKTVIALKPGDTMLTAQAFSYLDPQWAFVLTLLGGARLVVLERFRPSELWEKIGTYRATFFYCLAAMPLMLLSRPPAPNERSHRLKLVMCSAIPPERHAELEERFDVPWLEAYGTTESGSSIGVSWQDHSLCVGSGSIGKPLSHQRARLVDEDFNDVPQGAVGELLLSGPGLMSGYWRNESATAAVMHEGWYRTGDLARQDDGGFFYIVGRTKDMIRRAGENIAAAEIENILQLHPKVLVAACIAVPDPVRNEEVKAFVTLSAPVDVAELAAFLEQRLARFKIPRYWAIVEELPMTVSARVSKALLPRDVGAGVIDRSLIQPA